MNAIRTLVSAISIVVGVLLIAAWALAQAVVNLVEDGTAARTMTERALQSPVVMGAVTDDLTNRTANALTDRGLNVAALGLEGPLNQVISRAVGSEAFREALVDQVGLAHGQFVTQLTDEDRDSAPLTVSVDLSDVVNARMGELGGPASALPELAVAPVDVRVLDAERFDQARSGYNTVMWVKTWCLWLGLGVLVVGVLVSHRRQWFFAKALFALGAIALAVAGVVALLGPDSLVGLLPGGEDGAWGSLWQGVVGPEAASAVVQRSLLVGGVAVVGALVALAVGAAVGGRRR